MEKIKNEQRLLGFTMVSFDVKSLFTYRNNRYYFGLCL